MPAVSVPISHISCLYCPCHDSFLVSDEPGPTVCRALNAAPVTADQRYQYLALSTWSKIAMIAEFAIAQQDGFLDGIFGTFAGTHTLVTRSHTFPLDMVRS